MFKESELDFNDLWKVYFDDTLYAVLIPIGCSLNKNTIPKEDD